LPVESLTGLLFRLSSVLVPEVTDAAGDASAAGTEGQVEILKKISTPVTNRIIQVDRTLVTRVAIETNRTQLDSYLAESMIVQSSSVKHLFINTPLGDATAGSILLIVSVVAFSTCVLLLSRLLESLVRCQAAVWSKRVLNMMSLEIKWMPCLADYIVILIGCVLTFLMQSSTITTSTLIPLVGMEIVRLEKMLPFCIGANIGAAVTGVMSALVSRDVGVGLHVMLANFLFNFIGFVLWFHMRFVPLGMARLLGELAADIKWFPVCYIIVVFGLSPSMVFLLSLSGPGAVGAVCLPLGLLLFGLMLLVVFRRNRPHLLPSMLQRNPDWLPTALRVGERTEAVHKMSTQDQRAVGLTQRWWQAPIAWGLGWMVLTMLLCSVPNAHWANLKPQDFDPRADVSIGAWQVCSKMYEKEYLWASPRQPCDTKALEECSGITSCDFMSKDLRLFARRAKFEAAWKACSTNCTTDEFGDHCLSMDCGGAFKRQCRRLLNLVPHGYEVRYGRANEVAWAAGPTCRPAAVLCDNSRALSLAGVIVIAGMCIISLGQLLLLISVFRPRWDSMPQLRRGSFAAYSLGSLALATSCISFQVALNSQAVCIVADQAGTGAVSATGRFRSIIRNDGAASMDLMIVACVLSFVVTGLLMHHTKPCRKSAWTRRSCRDFVEDGSEEKSTSNWSHHSSPRHLSGIPSKEDLEDGLDPKQISLECVSDRPNSFVREGSNSKADPEVIGCVQALDFDASPVKAETEVADAGLQSCDEEKSRRKQKKEAKRKRERQERAGLVDKVEPNKGLLCCVLMR